MVWYDCEYYQLERYTMSNKPAFIAYQVEDAGQGEDTTKGHWLEIGAAWPHKDGKGYSINLRALPVDGRIVLREHLEREQPEA